MKYIPILFNAAMVQALEEGRKTQTRRVVKPQPDSGLEDGHGTEIKCPYGDIGDVLWVRETWALTTNVNNEAGWPGKRPFIPVKSDDDKILRSAYVWRADGDLQWLDDDGFDTDKSYWKPSIHMPKSAARIFLKITGKRIERLQDISEGDAVAEGIIRVYQLDENYETYYHNYMYDGKTSHWDVLADSAVHPYQTLWQSINGPESWSENPFVWVIEFEKIDKPEDFNYA